jgi:hypothetical protein
MVKRVKVERQQKYPNLNQAKPKAVQKLLDAHSEIETIDLAVEDVFNEEQKSRRAWAAHNKFIRQAISDDVKIEDAFGRLIPDSAK